MTRTQASVKEQSTEEIAQPPSALLPESGEKSDPGTLRGVLA